MTPSKPGTEPAAAPSAAAVAGAQLPHDGAMAPRGMYEVEDFPHLAWRRRLWVLGLALATAAVVMGSVLAPPGASKTKRLPAPDPARCANGQDTGCVGGTATVIVAPLSPSGSAGAVGRATAPGASAAR